MKYIIPFILYYLLGTAFAGPSTVNLLLTKNVSLSEKNSLLTGLSRESQLRDKDETRGALIRTKNLVPIELVYHFDGKIVSPKSLKLKSSGLKNSKVMIEVLVSTLSPVAGFKSLRIEPIKKKSRWQRFSFEQSAAKWVMIKIIPIKKDAHFKILELGLMGYASAPKTVYQFDESPAKAFSVLAKLKNSVSVKISADEASLFKDAADGRFDYWSFAEASLLSSGIINKSLRKKYLKVIKRLEKKALLATSSLKNPLKKGEALLRWLHSHPFKKGYVKDQTDVSSILKMNTYNCVSSATLYNILARRMGMDARGIEVPDHAFSILYDGTKHVDIETTTTGGFNPSRNKMGLNDFQKKTGFVYIRDKHRSKRREISEVGMVALTYYNHGVSLSNEKKYHASLVNYFKALSLDPKSKSSVKNALAVLSNWSNELLKKGKYSKAKLILETGLELAPKDRNLKHNYKVFWENRVSRSIDRGDVSKSFAVIKEAFKKTKDKSFKKMQVRVFSKPGEQKILKGDWKGGLLLAEKGLKLVDQDIKKDIIRWHSNIVLRWSNKELSLRHFSFSVDLLERALKLKGVGWRIKNNLAYAIEQWGSYIKKTKGERAAKDFLKKMAKRFPDQNKVQQIVGRFSDLKAKKALKKGDYRAAINIYAAGLEASPKDSTLKKNTIYTVDKWSRELAKKKGIVAAETLLVSMAKKFPENSKISRMRGSIVTAYAEKASKRKEHQKAIKILKDGKTFFKNKSKLDRVVNYIYYNKANEFTKKRKWAEAISVYSSGFKLHPKNSKLKRNIVASWDSWARTYMDKKEWNKAIAIYEKALKALPGTGLFKNNIRYCKSQI